MTKLLSINSDTKTVKGLSSGYLTAIMYLEPDSMTCPHHTKECIKECLINTGRMPMAKEARDNRMRLFRENRAAFNYILMKELKDFIKKADKKGLTPAIRLNGTSDIVWEAYKIEGKTVFEHFPHVQFYDYTPNSYRLKRVLPSNYHLTFSLKDNNLDKAIEVIQNGAFNVAVIFRNELPKQWEGIEVIDGDKTDLRFLDKKGVIVGLKAKGKARYNINGLVQD